MTREKSLGDLNAHIVTSEDQILGHLVRYDSKTLGRTDGGLRALWRCSCGVPQHVTLRTCRHVASHDDALRCIVCEGDPEGQVGRKIGGVDEGEVLVRQLVARYWPREVLAAQVYAWDECPKLVDLFLPLRKLIIEHDGRSHFHELPGDRGKGKSKLERDLEFDIEAQGQGFKVLRLHWKDEDKFSVCIALALANCKFPEPVYSPSYAAHGRPALTL